MGPPMGSYGWAGTNSRLAETGRQPGTVMLIPLRVKGVPRGVAVTTGAGVGSAGAGVMTSGIGAGPVAVTTMMLGVLVTAGSAGLKGRLQLTMKTSRMRRGRIFFIAGPLVEVENVITMIAHFSQKVTGEFS